MASIMTIDPGLGGTGIAIWDTEQWEVQKKLNEHKSYPINPTVTLTIYKKEKILFGIEKLCMKHNVVLAYIENAYYGASEKGQVTASSGALVKLSEFIGEITSILKCYCQVRLVSPQKWKGTMTKEAVIHRILKRCPHIVATSHAWDAVGIGLFEVGVF